jgi:hypothetical protein
MTKRSTNKRNKSSTNKSNTNKRNKRNTNKRTAKKYINMIGCSKKSKHENNVSKCPNCGPNCHCGPKCKCSHPCPGKCYLNHRLKGGSNGCGSNGCPISPMSYKQMNQFGGGDGDDFKPILGIGQNGGRFFKTDINPIPGPKIGSPWGPSFSKLPGVDGISGNRNYFKEVDVVKNPQQQMMLDDSGYKNFMSLIGGKQRKHKSKGGGLIPQDLVNLGRDFTFNINSAYNALNGYKAPVNPLPYKGQLTGSLNNKIIL